MNFHSEPLNLLTLYLPLHVEHVCCATMTYLAAFQQVGRWSYASNLIRASETSGLLPDLMARGLGWIGTVLVRWLISIRWMKMDSVGFGLLDEVFHSFGKLCQLCLNFCVDFFGFCPLVTVFAKHFISFPLTARCSCCETHSSFPVSSVSPGGLEYSPFNLAFITMVQALSPLWSQQIQASWFQQLK